MSDLNIFQQVFSLSMKICSVSTLTGTAEVLADQLSINLAGFFQESAFAGSSSWKTVWGPQVWQAPFSSVADQAIAVSLGTNTSNGVPTYVVSIAATSAASAYDVFFEDAAVEPLYMSPLPGIGDQVVSVGNWTALQVLLSLSSGGQTLAQFLASVADSGADVVFAGHSLGGGLTPLLAYSLYPNGTGSGWRNVRTFATAGPATASQAFATAFDKAYPVVTVGTGYQMWNANQYNTRDIVPNAWANTPAAPSLQQITAGDKSSTTAMFYTTFLFEAEVAALATIAQVLAGSANNPYVVVNNNPLFTGARYNQTPIATTDALAQEVLYQHIAAYIGEFGVSNLIPTSDVSGIQPPLLNLVRSLGARVTAPEESALEPA